MSSDVQREELANEAWVLMFDHLRAHKHIFTGVAHEMGLTPGDLHALLSLDADEPRPMRAMAEEWRCDASNVTWMVDRLEQHGFVERQSLPNDRRVRTAALTEAGIAAQARARELLSQAPESFSNLEAGELEILVGLLERLAGHAARLKSPSAGGGPDHPRRCGLFEVCSAAVGDRTAQATAQRGIGETTIGPARGAVRDSGAAPRRWRVEALDARSDSFEAAERIEYEVFLEQGYCEAAASGRSEEYDPWRGASTFHAAFAPERQHRGRRALDHRLLRRPARRQVRAFGGLPGRSCL